MNEEDAETSSSSCNQTSDDGRKVFVSRLPVMWDEEHLRNHFAACFGEVETATISWNWKDDSKFSMGYGYVTFVNEEHTRAALQQGSMHVKKKTIHIRPIDRQNTNDRPGLCYAWQQHRCVKGGECKFLHEGVGACAKVAEPNKGLSRRKCMSFKSKGKCSKGDKCSFLHISKRNEKTNHKNGTDLNENVINMDKKCTNESEVPEAAKEPGSVMICRFYTKKGNCKKGSQCKFKHVVPDDSLRKRKRIDGNLLVENRKKLLTGTE